ncbi:MAG: hypothetical protein HEQ20_18300 [Aphanizomenon flos-aquae KM1D3_PB]|uniref:type II toxin-antitoxin system HicB family antitoxin n=1 Tax=Aphanizomenon flos-aquae TaxID=1176 RepID=UPI000B117A16|nr:type II toxin-antitoxin system HicB family antitoxin [Aphanizomenon flos-aquae]QSV69386.1 MAG: hypothetical protein HEQ20_18300 [Aphanizomenon flos-aquae KM1D3_PB]
MPFAFCLAITTIFNTNLLTCEEAVKNAQEVIEMLIAEYQEDGKPLPVVKSLEQLMNVA